MEGNERTRLGIWLALTALGACATSPDARNAPPWLAETAAEARNVDYPSLGTLPEKSSMLRQPSGWSQLDAELAAVAERLKASPRSAPPQPDAALQAELEQQARELLQEKAVASAPDRVPE